MTQEQETIFLNEAGVQVTNTRLMLPNETYAMSGITSVQSHEDKPSKAGPIIFLIIGILSVIAGGGGIILGAILIVIGGGWLFLQKTTYNVLLKTASGEAKALSSQDNEWVSKVINAINESIIHRG